MTRVGKGVAVAIAIAIVTEIIPWWVALIVGAAFIFLAAFIDELGNQFEDN